MDGGTLSPGFRLYIHERAKFTKKIEKYTGRKLVMKRFVVYLTVTVLYVGLAVVPVQAYESDTEDLKIVERISKAYISLAAKIGPGVVTVFVEREVPAQNDFRGTPFEHFFRQPRRSRPQEEPRLQQGQGSGFIIRQNDEYYILTNNHVIRGADEIEVGLADDRTFEAEVVGADSLSDLAILKIEADDLPYLQLGDSDAVEVGQWVLAVGNPFGYEHTVTDGIVSALGRGRLGREYGSFIQTNVAINPGNSGGPLVNLQGEVVGINTAIISRSGGYDGIGLSIPVNLAKDVLGQLLEHGEVRRGVLGVKIEDVDKDLADALGMRNTHGVLVEVVIPDLPAAAAGIEQGDVILAVDGVPVENVLKLRNKIGQTAPGTEVQLRILRERKEKKIKVVLDKLSADAFAPEEENKAVEVGLGMELRELTPQIARRLGYEMGSGVLIADVKRRSVAGKRGLRSGDLIVEVDQQPMRSVQDYEEALEDKEGGDSVLFLIRRGNSTNFVALRLPKG